MSHFHTSGDDHFLFLEGGGGNLVKTPRHVRRFSRFRIYARFAAGIRTKWKEANDGLKRRGDPSGKHKLRRVFQVRPDKNDR